MTANLRAELSSDSDYGLSFDQNLTSDRCNPDSISLALTYSNVFKSNMDRSNL